MECLARPLKRALVTSSTDTSFPAKIPTITEPTNDGVVQLATGPGGIVPCKMRLFPFGTGADNGVFDMRVIGWTRYTAGTSSGIIWWPYILASYTCTMSADVGVAGAPIVATERACDTVVILSEPTITSDVTRFGTSWVYSPANDTQGWVQMQIGPVEKIEFTFDLGSGSPTAANCLVGLYG